MAWNIKSSYQKRLSREKGTVFKEAGGKVRVALAYPNTYYVGMSNLGFLSLYKWLNHYPDVVAERVFLPSQEEARLYEKSGAVLMSLESQRPVEQFHVIAFSISFENDYINLLNILDLARIPSLSSARNPSHPLVLAGGVATFLNPEPISPFIDLFVLGEVEPLLDELVDSLRELTQSPDKRGELLSEESRKPGFYVPSLYHVSYDDLGRISAFTPQGKSPAKIVRVRSTPGQWEPPQSSIVTPDTEFAGMALLEIGRACGRGCRYCAAGYVYRPPRVSDIDVLLNEVDKALKRSSTVGLISPGIADIPFLGEIVRFIHEQAGRASLSSIRADALDQEMVELIYKMGQKSLAIAPEAGSIRLRNVMNKDLSDEALLEAASKLCNAGLKTIKLYFMLGLPTEEISDVEAIPALVKKIRHTMIKNRRHHSAAVPVLNASVSCFVPKPNTPFQWEPMDRVEQLKKKLRLLQKSVHGIKGAQLHFEPPKWAYIQTLLSMGDRRVSTIIREAASRGGRWQDAFTHTDLNPDFFVYRRRDTEEILPWDFIDHGVKKEFFVAEYARALKGEPTPGCDPEHCHRCGIC